MKSTYKKYLLLSGLVMLAGVLLNCSEESLLNDGKPWVRYVRVTTPAASDSLLVAAGQGQMIAIMGENLQDVRELWINDRRATLNPSFITAKSIITRVPSQIPDVITNIMTLIFANGSSLQYDFAVDISKPRISYMRSEFVNTGETAVIVGDYFYEPLTVTFSGGVTAEIISIEDQMLQVIVPEGAQPGQIAITTNFGETQSDFWFRDSRNVFGSMEVASSDGWWHGYTMIVSSDPDIEPINNKFLRVNSQLGSGQWFEFFVGEGGTMAEETQNIPAEAILKPEDYSFKFEINTLSSLAGAKIHIYIGNNMGADRASQQYVWQPNVDTGGAWETISIPFSSILSNNPNIAVDPNGYGISFWFWEGTVELHADFAMDNLRVVPNVIK